MDERNTRTLTHEEVVAIRLALSAVLVNLNKKSSMIDRATDTEVIDPLHISFAKERKMAEDLLELMDGAEEVVVHLTN